MEEKVYELLQEWHVLLKNGTITEEEFAAKKRELLGTKKDTSSPSNESSVNLKNKKKINGANLLIIILSVIILVGLAFFMYSYYSYKNLDVVNNKIVLESQPSMNNSSNIKESQIDTGGASWKTFFSTNQTSYSIELPYFFSEGTLTSTGVQNYNCDSKYNIQLSITPL